MIISGVSFIQVKKIDENVKNMLHATYEYQNSFMCG